MIAPEITVEPRGLGDLERLAREIGFIHHAVALDDHAIHRADVMRIDHERVAHGNLRQRHIQRFPIRRFRWAIEGIRLASAASTEEALRNA